MTPRIVRATPLHADAWARMRSALWPLDEGEQNGHAEEIAHLLAAADPEILTLLAFDGDEPIGFAEAALRHDYVNGCDTSPVLFLEGIYVCPKARGRGVARALSDAIAAWGRKLGCTEYASDAALDNHASHAFHAALGFAGTERVVCFRRLLGAPA